MSLSKEYKRIHRDLLANGFMLSNNKHKSSHMVYKNESGKIIVIPKSCNKYLIERLYKENNIIGG